MRAFEVAGDPAVDAEVDEGGEGPDVFGFGEGAEVAGEGGDGEVYGQREVLAVEECGDGKGDAGTHGGDGADEDAEEDGGLEREVGRVEVRDADANHDAEDEGSGDEGDECGGLAAGAVGEQEQVAEGAGAGE